MHDAWMFYGFYALILLVPLAGYIRWQTGREQRAREAAARGELFSEGPRAQHPHIDVSNCIGCQGCTSACPEGQVLGMVGGKAAIIRPYRCIGHGLCADACPVGAITLVRASPGISANLPHLTEELETSVPNLYIAGELGGLALIRNAVQQGRSCIDTIAQRLEGPSRGPTDLLDVLIVGAGPAGISASLRAIERNLKYLTIEREEIGGTISKYPRQKLVMTSPVELPLFGTIKAKQLSKENLLSIWKSVTDRPDFHVRTKETVESIHRETDGTFTIATHKEQYRARAVVLAMGRSGTPKTLGVQGEELPKVMYRLIEADHYTNRNILVVGGGDSAVEAAVGLAMQRGNNVTLSYRRDAFVRIKERNASRLNDFSSAGKLRVIYNSAPVKFTESSAILDISGMRHELPNDFVWILAGGVPPNEFLGKAGIRLGPIDVTLVAVNSARETMSAVGERMS